MNDLLPGFLGQGAALGTIWLVARLAGYRWHPMTFTKIRR
jgi:hypothetical protein